MQGWDICQLFQGIFLLLLFLCFFNFFSVARFYKDRSLAVGERNCCCKVVRNCCKVVRNCCCKVVRSSCCKVVRSSCCKVVRNCCCKVVRRRAEL